MPTIQLCISSSSIVEYKWWHASVVPYDMVDKNIILYFGCANLETILSLPTKLGIPSLHCAILSLRKFQVGAEHNYIYPDNPAGSWSKLTFFIYPIQNSQLIPGPLWQRKFVMIRKNIMILWKREWVKNLQVYNCTEFSWIANLLFLDCG